MKEVYCKNLPPFLPKVSSRLRAGGLFSCNNSCLLESPGQPTKVDFFKKEYLNPVFLPFTFGLEIYFQRPRHEIGFPNIFCRIGFKRLQNVFFPVDNKLDNLNMYFTHSPLAFGFWRGLAAIFQSSFVQSLSVIRSDNAINSNKNFPQDTIFMSHKLRLISSPSIATAVLQVYSGFLQIRFLFGQIHLLTKANILSNLKF